MAILSLSFGDIMRKSGPLDDESSFPSRGLCAVLGQLLVRWIVK